MSLDDEESLVKISKVAVFYLMEETFKPGWEMAYNSC